MDSKSLTLFTAVAIALVGCGGAETVEFESRDSVCADPSATPCATTQPALSAEQRSREVVETMADTTVTYVVSVIDLPEATPDPDGAGPLRSAAAGFNLDVLDSGDGSTAADATCEEFTQDYVGLNDPNLVGVDNALQSLVGTIEGLLDASTCPGMTTDGCLGATLQGQITDGSLILLMQVSGINDYMFDSAVQLQLILGEVPGGGAPTIGGDGRLEAGQAFDVVMNLGVPVDGDIFSGRLRANTDTLTITIDTGGFSLPLMISNAEVRFDITATSLSNGLIGGYLTTESIITAAAMIMPGIEATVRSVVESIADIQPSAADPAVCDAVSVGLTFGATTATVN